MEIIKADIDRCHDVRQLINTWCAIGGNQRGYKKFPHFQLGLYGDHLFLWLAFIDNPEFEKEMAQTFLKHKSMFEKLPDDFVVCFDHTTTKYIAIRDAELEKGLKRWRDVKKGEFLVGRIIQSNDPILKNIEAAQAFMLNTYKQLLPLYQLAYQVRK